MEVQNDAKNIDQYMHQNTTAVIPELYSNYMNQFPPDDDIVRYHIVYPMENNQIQEFETYFLGSVQIMNSRFYYVAYSEPQCFFWDHLPPKYQNNQIMD